MVLFPLYHRRSFFHCVDFFGFSSLPDGVVLIEDKAHYQKEFDYYDFLIKTKTLYDEYVNIKDSSDHKGTYMMSQTMRVLGHMLPIMAVLISFYVLTNEYNGTTIKNIMASPIKRRQIFLGKILFVAAVNVFILLLAVLFPIIFGGIDNTAMVMLYGSGGYYAKAAFPHMFFPKLVGTILSMMFYSVLSALLGQLGKTKGLGFLLSAAGYGVIQIIYSILNAIVGVVKIYMMPLAFMQYSLQYDISDAFQTFSGGWLVIIIATVIVAAVAVVCTILGAKMASKKDY